MKYVSIYELNPSKLSKTHLCIFHLNLFLKDQSQPTNTFHFNKNIPKFESFNTDLGDVQF